MTYKTPGHSSSPAFRNTQNFTLSMERLSTECSNRLLVQTPRKELNNSTSRSAAAGSNGATLQQCAIGPNSATLQWRDHALSDPTMKWCNGAATVRQRKKAP